MHVMRREREREWTRCMLSRREGHALAHAPRMYARTWVVCSVRIDDGAGRLVVGARAHTHTYSHILARTHARTHARAHTHTHNHSPTHSLTHSQTHTDACMHAPQAHQRTPNQRQVRKEVDNLMTMVCTCQCICLHTSVVAKVPK